MTRIMIDFLDLPEQSVEIRQSAIEMIWTKGEMYLQRIKHPIYYATQPTMVPK